MYPHQSERLEAVLQAFDVDAVIATLPADIAYLTGFWSFSREVYAADVAAVYSRGTTALVIPALDAPAFTAGGAAADHVACHGSFFVGLAAGADDHARRAAALVADAAETSTAALTRVLEALGLRNARIGLDDGAGSAIASQQSGFRVTPAVGAVRRARMVKGPYEIDCLARALHIAEEAIHAVLGELKPGTTEREAVDLYERAVTARGATPYAAMIAFGPDAAVPAGPAGDRALRSGELVRFDVGAAFKGYRGDVARMGVLGEPEPHAQRAYDAVEAGVQAALDAIAPGVEGGRVFDAAVTAVRDAGLPDFGRHHVGHGIGLEPAESPWIRPGGERLEAGMVLRVEAPYYELGAFGVSVKETVLVTLGGATVVNRSHRGLVSLD